VYIEVNGSTECHIGGLVLFEKCAIIALWRNV